jgi:hypothetical protein
MRQVTEDAAGTAAALRQTSETARTALQDFTTVDGAGARITQTIRNTLASIEEVTNDLAEGTEALKRSFLFSGFFRDRGFYDLDAISREAYQAGLLERDNRTAVRIWLDASVLFVADPEVGEQLTADGRRRLDQAMAQLVQYPRDSPLVVEGYARGGDADSPSATLATPPGTGAARGTDVAHARASHVDARSGASASRIRRRFTALLLVRERQHPVEIPVAVQPLVADAERPVGEEGEEQQHRRNDVRPLRDLRQQGVLADEVRHVPDAEEVDAVAPGHHEQEAADRHDEHAEVEQGDGGLIRARRTGP